MTKEKTMKDIQREVDEYIGQFKEGYFSPLAMMARLTEEPWRTGEGNQPSLRRKTKEKNRIGKKDRRRNRRRIVRFSLSCEFASYIIG